MRQEEIIQCFLKHGKLLSPDSVKMMMNMPITELLEVDWPEIVITPKHINTILEHRHDQNTKQIEILVNITHKPMLNQAEQLAILNTRFSRIREMLMNKLDKPFISIAKATRMKADEIWLLGVVRAIHESTGQEEVRLELEDPTGVTQVWFERSPGCELDEIVAIRARVVGRMLIGQNVWWPDVPLRSASRGVGRLCVLSDLHLDEAPEDQLKQFLYWYGQHGADWLVVAGDVGGCGGFERFNELFVEYCSDKLVVVIPGESDTNQEFPQPPFGCSSNSNILCLSNPSMLAVGRLNVLLIHSFNIRMLKTRVLGGTLLPGDPLTLNILPDIICHGHDHQPHVYNYKAITCANAGSLLSSFRPVLIDLTTRVWEQMSFG